MDERETRHLRHCQDFSAPFVVPVGVLIGTAATPILAKALYEISEVVAVVFPASQRPYWEDQPNVEGIRSRS